MMSWPVIAVDSAWTNPASAGLETSTSSREETKRNNDRIRACMVAGGERPGNAGPRFSLTLVLFVRVGQLRGSAVDAVRDDSIFRARFFADRPRNDTNRVSARTARWNCFCRWM